MADEDEGFGPLPAFTEGPDADQELTMQDALADSPVLAIGADDPVPLGRAPAYDFAAHLLLPGVAGGPLMTRGRATLQTWIEKCARTRRGESPAVDPDFGCDLMPEDVLSEGSSFDPTAVAEYISSMERALLVHPRISSVDDVLVDGDEDSDGVFVSFTVTVDDEDEPLTFNRLAVG